VILTYKYPTAEQEAVMSDIQWVGCWLYNRALDYRRKRWCESRHTATYYEQAAMWRDWRNEQPDENPLQVFRRLDSAFRDRFNSVNFKLGDGANLKGWKLYLQNLGLITVRWHRELPGDAKLKNIILLRKPSGWYVLLQVELPDPEPEPHEGPAVGIDVGIHHALALSDGTIIDSPRHLEQSLRKLRVMQRTVARRRKGSRRWWKAVCQVQRQQERIANQRRDWWHKMTAWLVTTYGVIALEDLGLNFMARAAHDVSIGIFRDLLDYKAVRAGVEVIMFDPKHTSQVCRECGCIVDKKLSERVHCCPHCGYTVDRDVNAALNILSRSGRDRQALTWPVGVSVA
jgi:putative transposase